MASVCASGLNEGVFSGGRITNCGVAATMATAATLQANRSRHGSRWTRRVD
jgi:hypothetical protein